MLFATFFTASLLLAPALAALTVDTVQLTQCQDATLTWTPDANSKGPYNLIVVDPKSPCDSNLKDLGDHDGNSAPWKVDIAAGTQVQLSLQDANGDEAWSGPIQIGSGDSSCLPAASQPAGASSNASSNPAVAAANSPASNPAAAVSSPSAAAGSTGSTSSSAPVQAAGAAANNLGKKTGGASASYVNTSIMVLGAVGTAFTLIL